MQAQIHFWRLRAWPAQGAAPPSPIIQNIAIYVTIVSLGPRSAGARPGTQQERSHRNRQIRTFIGRRQKCRLGTHNHTASSADAGRTLGDCASSELNHAASRRAAATAPTKGPIQKTWRQK